MRISLLGLFIANVVSRARLSRKSQQEPSSMGLLGEAFFLCLGELLGLRETLPRQARTSQTAPAFSLCEAAWALARDPLGKSSADWGKRGMIAPEGRRSSFRGRMGPCGDTKERRLLLEGPLWVLFRYQAFVLRGRRPSLRELRFLLKGSLFDRDRDVGILVLHLNDLAPRSRCHRLIQLLC